MYICLCFSIPAEEVQDFIKENPTLKNEEIINKLKIGYSCNSCMQDINETLNKIREGKPLIDPFEEFLDDYY